MSKHRRPSSGHLATLPSRGARTSGAALLGTVLAVGLLPATAGAAFAATPTARTCSAGDLTKLQEAAATAKANVEKAVGADAKAAAQLIADAAQTKVDACKPTKDKGKGGKGGWDKGKDKHDKDEHGKWQGRDHDGDDDDADDDDEDDDETDATKDEKPAEKTEKSDKSTEVAAASSGDSPVTVTDVPATTDVAGTSQVSDVPVGSVDAGDGSTAESHIGEALVGLGALGLVGAGAGVAVQRRRRSA